MAFSYRLVRVSWTAETPSVCPSGLFGCGIRRRPVPRCGSRIRAPFQMKQEIPFGTGPRRSKWDFLLHLGSSGDGHVLGRFLDTLLSIKPLFVDYASIVRFSTYVVYLSIVEEKLERYSFAVNLMDTCRFSGGSAAEKKGASWPLPRRITSSRRLPR